jgi:hypothetical protein
MIFMIGALLFVLAATGAAIWLAVDARRRHSHAPLAAVGAIDLFCGLVIVGLMVLHLSAVIGLAVSGRGFGGATSFTYDFRFYSLLMLGVVIIIPGLVFVLHARRLTEGDAEAWTRALWASGVLLLINIPLLPIQLFALDHVLLATINLVSLLAARGILGRLRRETLTPDITLHPPKGVSV